MREVDYVVVGGGLTGSVIARMLADKGRDVIVLDRRNHAGGNVHDHVHESGIRIHTYGPHYFRTSSDRIWEFVNRFASFNTYRAIVKSLVDEAHENWPIAASYIRRAIGENWVPEFRGQPTNFEEAALSLMPRSVYERFVKEYNEKQWGVPARELSAGLCKRFDVRENDDPHLTPRATYQGIPSDGYAAMMNRMLEGIEVILNCDYTDCRNDFRARRMLVFTGPIDQYFAFDLGRLAYRGQQRVHRYFRDASVIQPCGQVNNPSHAGGRHIRTLEWKHMMPASQRALITGTVLTEETPYSPTDVAAYEYPFPDEKNDRLYRRYRERAESLSSVLICGRLGEYRYIDMDQAIARAMILADRILQHNKP